MSDLQKYFAGREQFIELLEAVGICTLEQFASVDPFTVLPELHQAKRMLNLKTEIPTAPVFKEWVRQALTSPIAPDPSLLVSPEDDGIPLAIPVETQVPDSCKTIQRNRTQIQYANDPKKHLSTKAKQQEEQNYQPAKHSTVIKHSKNNFHKKGVNHTTPFQTWLGAVIVLFLFVCVLSSIAVTTIVLLNGEQGWLIISLCFGPWILALLLYLSLALPQKCSVCRFHIFSFKKCTHNKVAHYVPLFGYVFATALHIFLFRWFRCPVCGVSQQLRSHSKRHKH